MTVTIFANCAFFVKVKKLSVLEKSRLNGCIKENGGQIKFVLNHECTHVVTDDANSLSSIHLKAIKKYQLPIVGADFIWNSVKERRLLQADEYEAQQSWTHIPDRGNSHRLESSSADKLLSEHFFGVYGDDHLEKRTPGKNEWDSSKAHDNSNVGELRWFSNNDENVPYFPEDFVVAKYDVLEQVTAPGRYVVVELQCSRQHCDYPFCISACYSQLDGKEFQKRFIPTKTSEEARRVYEFCTENMKNENYQFKEDVPHEVEYLASEKLQEVLIAEATNSSSLPETVSKFVELIWIEALGHLTPLLAKPVTDLSLNDVSRAEGILLRARKALDEMESPKEKMEIMSEFYKIIPHKSGLSYDVTRKLLSTKHSLCQLIRDMLNVHETNMSIPNPPSLSKYRALRCRICPVFGEEFRDIEERMDQYTGEHLANVLEIYRVGRMTEVAAFESHLGNVQSLYHSSSVHNFVGILSRGLLLPKIVVEEHGVERTDCGHLGSGIYFSDSVSACINYSWPNRTDGTRLLLICDVALGKCFETGHMDSSLTAAPPGYDSVHGLARKKGKLRKGRDFKDDEFVVYRASQVKIKYVVKFSLTGDKVKEFHPEIQEVPPSLEHQPQPEDYKMPSKNLLNNVTAGLLDRSGNPIPLKDLHIKGCIVDFVAEVVVFQVYENQSDSPIEAKYVFPLDDTAAVCGFEAFIKGKHIIGKVKEKEKAHREYREAISQGHGAYLMDQDAPDIFTVSVGNLPPSTKVLIKITYITELSYENECLAFHLPAAVAPWQQDKALNENTQDSVRKVSIRQVGTKPGGFSLEMSVEMPFEIKHISSWTHQLEIKKTDCNAVVRTVDNSFLDTSGFAMEILIGDVHLPRMWVEKDPGNETEACMLVFQPEFESPLDPLSTSGETVICLDCSNSMGGSTFQQAKQIALYALELCNFTTGNISVIKFGTSFEEFPFNPEPYTADLAALKNFIISATASMGNSDIWKVLHYLSLLYPSKSRRNILLISDGHIQNEGTTLQILKKNTHHTRIFTCGVGPAANRHMLRSLAQYGAGAFEYFDAKSKYNWERKMKSQTSRMSSVGCNAISIKWQQFDFDAPELMYAPAQIQSLFNHDRLLIYGFISHCTQATLNALIDNKELQTVVSTTELQKTTGTMLHKLAARAFIRDYEQGILDEDETEHEMKKQLLKSQIIELSLKNSIVTQFTSFVAIEERDTKEDQTADTLDVLELVAMVDVDFLPYMEYQSKGQVAPCKSLSFSSSAFIVEEEEEREREVGKGTHCGRNCAPIPKKLLFAQGGKLLQWYLGCRIAWLPNAANPETMLDFHLAEDLGVYEEVTIEKDEIEFVMKKKKKSKKRKSTVSMADHVPECMSFAPLRRVSFLKEPKKAVPLTEAEDLSMSLPFHMEEEFTGGMPAGDMSSSLLSSDLKLSDTSTPDIMPELADEISSPVNLTTKKVPSAFVAHSELRGSSLGFGFGIQNSAPISTLPPPPPCPLSGNIHTFGSPATGLFGPAFGSPTFGSPAAGHFGSQAVPQAPISSASPLPPVPGGIPNTLAFGSSAAGLFCSTSSPSLDSQAIPQAPISTAAAAAPPPPLPGGIRSMFASGSPATGPFGSTFGSPATGPFGSPAIPQAFSLRKFDMLQQKDPFPPPTLPAERAFAPFTLSPVHLKAFAQGIAQESVSPLRRVPEVQRSKEPPEASHKMHYSLQEDTLMKKCKIKKHQSFPAQKPQRVVSWPQLFKLQNQDGFWQLIPELGTLLDFDVDYFVNVSLAKKGINSLGPKGKEKLLRLIATLLVLQVIRFKRLEGLVFRSLTTLNDSPSSWAFEPVKKAVEWARRTEREFPAICQRLDLGKDWDFATKKLLHIEEIGIGITVVS
ncbi:protein mono-ADP-ribosyltransferase PARP4 isoform X2 [Zootoca vivipara]|uniref:protein mono-ADP-ribosyltransferase PARP4 isoform X2 n=1 Tax=Zootoca vivipara TaxID=8524 RepID=UPI001590DB6F|nr:protein mono-ADP-ribosyltransferase PARP4 isoform X2 [Zootoca vivipara]